MLHKVTMPDNDSYVRYEGIVQAAMLFDYEHNAYNIKGENQSVYRWSRYLIECGNYDMDADRYIEELNSSDIAE